ncbi:MAG TPA: PVC-type heme-binding CxxCH protein, partial [Pirellulales bacterium]
MRRLQLLGLATALLAAFGGGSRADEKTPAAPQVAARPDFAPIDYNLNETPARPTPGWVKPIDQGEKNPALKGLFTPAGIKVEVVADAPAVVNPVGMKFADDGTPYVLEWRVAPTSGHKAYEVKHADGTVTTVNRMEKSTRDELKILKDENGDGVYETSRVVMNDLEIPSSLLLHDDWIYFSGCGRIIRRQVKDPGQGLFEVVKEEEIVKGLCGFHHHQASGLTMSSDGWLFITSGDDDNFGEGTDGSRATILRTGAVVRCRPDGTQLQEFARGFRNPYRDLCFDHFGNIFHVDNDQEDGSKFQGVRLMNILEGADYGWRLAGGAVCCRTDFERGAVFGERPGKTASMLKTGRGSPAGLLVYQGTKFPAFFRGLLIYPDVYRKLVRAYTVERKGSTFEVTSQFELMRSEDGLFRPCQAVMGPDGAIYIVDWRTDSGGAGRLWGDGVNGRIYRLTWDGLPDAPAIPRGEMTAWMKGANEGVEGLLIGLETLDFELRNRHVERLVKLGRSSPDDVREKLVAFIKDGSRSVHARAAAMGAACRFYDESVQESLIGALSDPAEEVRRLAADLLGRNATGRFAGEGVIAELTARDEESPAVIRALALALGRVGSQHPEEAIRHETAAELLVGFEGAYDVNGAENPEYDAALTDGWLRGFELMGKDGTDQLVELAASGQEEDREWLVAALERMRTRAAAAALDEILALDGQFRDQHMVRLFEAYRNILVAPPINAKAVGEWLSRHADATSDVKLAGLETVALVGGVEPETLLSLALSLLKNDDAETRRRTVDAIGRAKLTVAAPALLTVLKEADRGIAERRSILTALGQLRSSNLPFTGKPTPPGVELLLGDLAALALDEKSGELRGDMLAIIGQIDFSKAEPVALKLLESSDAGLQSAAVNVLGADAARAQRIGHSFLDGKLPKSLLPQVASVLRKHADGPQSAAFNKMLGDVYRGALLVKLDPAEVKRIEELVAKQGDVKRGMDLFLDVKRTQCVNCHKLEGVGGQVGPDLSKVWETHTIAKLMESIVDPSKEVKEGYATWTLETTGGQIYTGLKILDDANEVVIRESTGKDVRTAKTDVESLEVGQKSLMPEGLVGQLNFDEFVDLVAFMKSRDGQAALRGRLQQAYVLGPFPMTLDGPPLTGAQLDPEQGVTIDGKEHRWEPLNAKPDGLLDLREVQPVENATVYVLATIDSPTAQNAELNLWFDDQIVVWLNG